MKKTLEGNHMDEHVTELEREIRRLSDGRDQQISRAMTVLVVMVKIGPNADRLAVSGAVRFIRRYRWPEA
jgi:hypothetical protein